MNDEKQNQTTKKTRYRKTVKCTPFSMSSLKEKK